MNNNLDHPFYYLQNFTFVLDWVSRRYGDLLDAEENRLVEQFSALPEQSRALLVRMVMRKGAVFRSAKLQYDEIGDTATAMAPLVAAGWVMADPVLTLEQLYTSLTKDEFAAALGLSTSKAKKGDLYAAACEQKPEARPFSMWCASLDEQAWELRADAVCDRIRLMFFGNLYQDWTEFVLSDLGVYTYETVEFSAASRAFHTRADIDFYLHCHACRERFHELQGEQFDAEQETQGMRGIEHDLNAAGNGNAWLLERRARLLFQMGQRHEQLGSATDALRVYTACGYLGARMRRIRVLEKEARIGEALELAQTARSAPENAAESQQLERSLPRLMRKAGLTRAQAFPRIEAPTMHLTLPPPQEGLYVEEVARTYFAALDPAAHVCYVENALINSLFGLLCWDAVFQPVPGAFFHPFQSGPADLHSADFVKLRASQFNAWLAQLEDGSYRATIRANFRRKAGLQSPFVFWSAIDEALLELALDCIPAPHLAHWFARILQDIAANCSGFPDLIQFWPQEKRYRMIEIKGPGDRLQDNQLRLIDFALSHGMPLEVCYIAWEAAA